MLKRPRQSVLLRYMLAFVGIAIAACAALGAVTLNVSIQRFQNNANEAEEQRLHVAALEFASHMDTMNAIAMMVKTGMHYQPVFIQRNEYNHVELLKQFTQFTEYSPIVREYYLYYPDLGIIFSSQSEYTPSLFSEHKLGGMPIVQYRAALEQADTFLEIDTVPNAIFRVFSLEFRMSPPQERVRAYMVFELSKAELTARYRNLFSIEGVLDIRYGDQSLLSAEETQPDLSVSLEHGQRELMFSVTRETDEVFPGLSAFRRTMLLLISMTTLSFAFFAAVLAYTNYLPIRRLARKLDDGRPEDAEAPAHGNELVLIERVMDEIRRESHGSMTRLTESLMQISSLHRVLQQQMLLLVVSGEYDSRLQTHVAGAGMDFQRAALCAVHIIYDPSIDSDLLCERIMAASDISVTLYAAQLPGDRGWVAAACADDQDDLTEQLVILPEILQAQGMETRMRFGNIVHAPELLSHSLMQAENALTEERESEWYNRALLAEMKQALSIGDEERALACLDTITGDLAARPVSFLLQRYLLIDLVYQVAETGRELQRPPSEQAIQEAIVSHNVETYAAAVASIIRDICQHLPRHVPENDVAARVLAYIDANANDYAICLDSVAEACDISTKQVSRLVKGTAGQTFKEYLTRLRVERAKALLKGGVSAMETARLVGYQDISHFTKLFRAKTGYTPGQYRAMGFFREFSS